MKKPKDKWSSKQKPLLPEEPKQILEQKRFGKRIELLGKI
jgi:hypothetical protein